MTGLKRWAEIFPPTPFDKLMTGFDKLRANGKILLDPCREVITEHISNGFLWGDSDAPHGELGHHARCKT
jgi:hypothetical protein